MLKKAITLGIMVEAKKWKNVPPKHGWKNARKIKGYGTISTDSKKYMRRNMTDLGAYGSQKGKPAAVRSFSQQMSYAPSMTLGKKK